MTFKAENKNIWDLQAAVCLWPVNRLPTREKGQPHLFINFICTPPKLAES